MGTPDPTAALFNKVVLGARTPIYQRPLPLEGVVQSVSTGANGVRTAVVAAGGSAVPAVIASNAVVPTALGTPAAGSPCLVVFSSAGNPWVVAVA